VLSRSPIRQVRSVLERKVSLGPGQTLLLVGSRLCSSSLDIVTHQPSLKESVLQNLKFYLLIEYIQKLIVLKNVT